MTDAVADRAVALTAFLSGPIQDVRALLVHDAAATIGGPRRVDSRHVVAEVDVPFGQRGMVSRAALVSIGEARCEAGHVALSIGLSALDGSRWFPTFEGELTADDAGMGETCLRLKGSYLLPLGVVGRLSGRAGGDRLARASLFAFFMSIVTASERQLAQREPALRA